MTKELYLVRNINLANFLIISNFELVEMQIQEDNAVWCFWDTKEMRDLKEVFYNEKNIMINMTDWIREMKNRKIEVGVAKENNPKPGERIGIEIEVIDDNNMNVS